MTAHRSNDRNVLAEAFGAGYGERAERSGKAWA